MVQLGSEDVVGIPGADGLPGSPGMKGDVGPPGQSALCSPPPPSIFGGMGSGYCGCSKAFYTYSSSPNSRLRTKGNKLYFCCKLHRYNILHIQANLDSMEPMESMVKTGNLVILVTREFNVYISETESFCL